MDFTRSSWSDVISSCKFVIENWTKMLNTILTMVSSSMTHNVQQKITMHIFQCIHIASCWHTRWLVHLRAIIFWVEYVCVCHSVYLRWCYCCMYYNTILLLWTVTHTHTMMMKLQFSSSALSNFTCHHTPTQNKVIKIWTNELLETNVYFILYNIEYRIYKVSIYSYF